MHQPGLSADLDSFDLLDLVQVIQMARRNLSLVVRSGSQRLGMLRFAQGELLWAEFGALRGAEAFIALAAHHSGSIEELAWDGHEERNVSQPLARLVMQAVEYRDNHEQRQPPPPPEPLPDTRSRPIQPANPPPPIKTYGFFNGSNGVPHLDGASAASEALALDEDEAPAWVRDIHPAAERIAPPSAVNAPGSAVASSPFSPQPVPSIYMTQTEPLTPTPPGLGQAAFSSLLQEEMAVEIPEPTVPLTTPNGKFSLPSLANGNRPSLPAPREEKEDPPTVPLPSVQGGLWNYTAKREAPLADAQREAVSGLKLGIDALPGQALTMRATPAVATPPPLPAVTAPPSAPPVAPEPPSLLPSPVPLAVPEPPLPEPLVAAPPSTVAPSEEPKLSSLAILEQLAYGGMNHNGSAEAAPLEMGIPAAPAVPQASVNAAPALNSSVGSPVASPSTDGKRPLEQALETFAEQVGNACVATAVIRSDGKLLAEYKVRRGQDQDLASPAYHMAQVMQSSLRALLMGGWGDLEDTFITGSTHSVMLRRLGRAEKELFHIAVLERSGNPGLCRVRMRNNEAALLQLLSVDLPTRAS
ncbi:MAG TPA: DUF4388 domain-containing protein [Ktedonobacterales bacterium]|nr:DUF4388 domain-containing protein [Ktedonobacterales bacterium]